MTTASKKAPAANPPEQSSLDYLQQALDDLDNARQQAQHEAQAGIDSAVDRIREARKDLAARAHQEADGLQARLEHATDEVRLEVGRVAIRAQRTPDALTDMQTEIRNRKRRLSA
jgi:cbb3-type cytochrome oxidase cytochrome c subunit